jgi:hypothetical protein
MHIDLAGQRLSSEEALTLFNRFLSMMTWCDDQFAVLQEGWSGNPVPVPVPKRNLAFTTTHHWVFNRNSPQSTDARRALAIYRDGRNAEQNYLVGYAVLSYYKIIELKHKGRSESRRWFRDNLHVLDSSKGSADDLARFREACGEQPGEAYLYNACRTAVAHANTPYASDPDDIKELRRLDVAATILRRLARHFIKKELGVSDIPYDGT